MKKRNLICMVGASGSGKTTLEADLFAGGDYDRVISSTTRPRRQHEEHGVNYFFVTEAQFHTLDLIENAKFAGYRYGVPTSELFKSDKDMVAVVEPIGLEQILNTIIREDLDLRPIVVYMDIPDNVRFDNMIARGDSVSSVRARLARETIVKDFARSGIIPHIIVSELDENTTEFVRTQIAINIEIEESKDLTDESDEDYYPTSGSSKLLKEILMAQEQD